MEDQHCCLPGSTATLNSVIRRVTTCKRHRPCPRALPQGHTGLQLESAARYPDPRLGPGTSGYVSFWYSGRVWSGLVGSGRVWSGLVGWRWGFSGAGNKKNCKLVGKRHFKKIARGTSEKWKIGDQALWHSSNQS